LGILRAVAFFRFKVRYTCIIFLSVFLHASDLTGIKTKYFKVFFCYSANDLNFVNCPYSQYMYSFLSCILLYNKFLAVYFQYMHSFIPYIIHIRIALMIHINITNSTFFIICLIYFNEFSVYVQMHFAYSQNVLNFIPHNRGGAQIKPNLRSEIIFQTALKGHDKIRSVGPQIN
jgi:hypothetical protein